MYPYYVLTLVSILLFFNGFFPISKTATKYINKPPTHINGIAFNSTQLYSSNVEKTVLLVIDALRLDFVNPRYMPLTSNIVRQNGCFNKVKVETPTVTLPRIKALIAGNVPQFIDLVLNLVSSEVLEDSLIHSAHKQQQRIVFYGDDTWLKLFKNVFVRYEGTSSFFVRDFKEVDDNVTRNVHVELQKQDWDLMVLHYLGLDHIGHVYGPFSSLIPQKLKEMDEIIHEIYMELMSSRSLLVITGDHGMRDSGGHGGSTYSETHVPLLMLGHQCLNGSFPQTDIPVNLAVLLGLNIPSNSIGQLRENLLPFALDKYLFVLRYNSLLLTQKSNLCEDYFDLATKYHEMYIQRSDETSALKAAEFYKKCSDVISEHLINSSVKQNIGSLIVAILIKFNVLMFLLNNLIGSTSVQTRRLWNSPVTISFGFLLIAFTEVSLAIPLLSLVFICFFFGVLLANLISFIRCKYSFTNGMLSFLIISSIIHPLTFVSSSFVEEEHQFWYFFFNIFILTNMITFVKSKNYKDVFQYFGLFSGLRFLRTLNSTGDKWANYPDLSDWLLREECNAYYQLFFIFGLCTVFHSQYLLHKGKRKNKMSLVNSVALLLIYIFKNTEYNNILVGKLIWVLILCHAILFHDHLQTWILISSLMLKPYNVALISYCIYASLSYSAKFSNTAILTLSHTWLGSALYFAQGHSNSLASVDISGGYVGLSEYHSVLVIAQVLCHTYALPILCHLLVFRNVGVDKNKVWAILFCNRLFVIIWVCIITLMFRHHLFIWSVFAPKLFIECVHTVILFIEVSFYYCFGQIQYFFTKVRRSKYSSNFFK